MKIDLEQVKDCDHCFHTFGSFGCCSTVSNKLMFSCREGQRDYLIYRVFGIIDKEYEEWKTWDSHPEAIFENIKKAVLALKGEQG